MKKVLGILLSFTMILSLLAGCGSGSNTPSEPKDSGSEDSAAAPTEKVQVRIAHSGTENSMMHRAWVAAKEYMEENGNFECTIYSNGTLGSDVELAQAVQNGDIHLSACSTSNLTTFNQKLEVFSLPFAFADEETAYAVLDGDFGQKMLDSMDEVGLKALGYFESCNYRELSSNKPVHSPADLKGMKIRVMQSNLHIVIWEGLGANPTAIPFSELYTALQQGTVDAQDNPLELLIAQRFYEVQKYVTLTNHIFQVGMVTCNPAWYDSLSAEDQQVLKDAITVGVELQRKVAAEEKDNYIKTLTDAGLEVIELTDSERGEFQALMGAAEGVIAENVGQDLVDELKAAISAVG